MPKAKRINVYGHARIDDPQTAAAVRNLSLTVRKLRKKLRKGSRKPPRKTYGKLTRPPGTVVRWWRSPAQRRPSVQQKG